MSTRSNTSYVLELAARVTILTLIVAAFGWLTTLIEGIGA